jgi:hypothetical protein
VLIRLKAEFATIGVLIISFAYLTLFRSYGFQIEDEGTLLFHLDRAARGEAPYTDFHTGYTPGYYWLGSNALEAVDRSVVTLRSLLAILNATSAALLYKVARYRASAPLALLAPLAWLAFMPVYPGSFAMFNVPYPAWLATLCWLALAIALLTWEARRSLGVLALCGVIASLAFSIKLNAGAYAAAACVWVVIATARSDSLLDRAAAILATLLVACGVWVAFATRFWGIDAGIHLLPLVAIVALALWDLRGRFATETDVGALRALIVLTGGFLPLTAVWTVPTILRLGVDGFASDVLLLGSNAADIYWLDHPAVEPYAFAVAVGVIGFAAMGRLVAHRLIPLRVGIASTVLGMACVLAFALTIRHPSIAECCLLACTARSLGGVGSSGWTARAYQQRPRLRAYLGARRLLDCDVLAALSADGLCPCDVRGTADERAGRLAVGKRAQLVDARRDRECTRRAVAAGAGRRGSRCGDRRSAHQHVGRRSYCCLGRCFTDRILGAATDARRGR